MGNGQHRNRRGAARSRHGPHRGGAGANDRNDRRSATHLMPATPNGAPEATGAALPAGTDEPLADAGDDLDQSLDQTPEQAQAAEMAEERLERSAGELPGASPEARAETAPGVEVASSAGTPPEQSAREETAPAAPVADEAAAKAPPERRTPRGRFERFYAPGQGPRAEQNGHPHAAPGANGVNGANVVNGAHEAHEPHGAIRRAPREPLAAYTPSAAQPAEEDDAEVELSGPREDVRGPVGELIDALHDLFTHDRAIATQGSASRCGICYFHFALGELVYRESEGFYVCQPCERALAGARVPMVRRQQRL